MRIARAAVGALMVPAGWLCLSSAFAQDGPECFSKFTKFNVCEKAREIHSIVAPTLPMALNANITMTTAVVDGPRVVLTNFWRMTKPKMDALARDSGMRLVDWTSKMDLFTQNSICGQPVMAAFVRLGGQIQYVYKTEDGHTAFAPLVTTCPSP